MRKYYIHIAGLILFFLLFMGFSGTTRADQSPDPIELELLDLINEARRDPLAMAASFGLDPNQVLNDLPELAEILTQGLPPLTLNVVLSGAALEHTRDMLDNNYYSSDSPDGTTVTDRIITAGYPLSSCGETLGMLGFINFIEPGQAVGHVFENMFLDELNPERSEKRNILNSEFEEIGIAFGSGLFNFGSNNSNVYIVTCDFAVDEVSVLELEVLELINQAREKPLDMVQSLGLDPNKTLEDLPELRNILMEGLPPLVFDNKLYQAATGHSKDMMEQGYFSEQSLDGATPEDRIFETGYEPEVTGEIIGSLVSSGYLVEKEVAFQIFATKFKEELDPERKTERNILNGEFKNGSVSFDVLQFKEEGDRLGTYGLMVVDFGKSSLPAKPCLTGVVYGDANGDGLYTMGEGISDTSVTVDGGDASFALVTNVAGGFTLELEPGRYSVIIHENGDIPERVVDIGDENLGLWFKVNPGENVSD